MKVTIKISDELLEKLRSIKEYREESYEKVIWNLIENRLEFSKSTKDNMKLSERDIRKGKIISLEELQER